MKTTERKECKVCGNGYKEVVCPKCGCDMFHFNMSSDVLVKAIVGDGGGLEAVYAVGPHMNQHDEWCCAGCDTPIGDAESHGYLWTDLTSIEKKTVEELFHPNGLKK